MNYLSNLLIILAIFATISCNKKIPCNTHSTGTLNIVNEYDKSITVKDNFYIINLEVGEMYSNPYLQEGDYKISITSLDTMAIVDVVLEKCKSSDVIFN